MICSNERKYMGTVRIGLSLAIRYLASLIISFVVFLSFIAIFTLPLTHAVGYDAYIADETTGHSRKVYTHYYSDGEDTKKMQYESLGLTVYTAELRSELSRVGAALVFATAQLASICLFIALVPSRLYRLGAKDAESRKGLSIRRWLIPSLFPTAISLTGYILLLLNKLQWIGNHGLSLYRYTNYHLYGFLRILLGTGNDCSQIGWISVLLAIFPAALTILACGLLYQFGYRNIHPLNALKNIIKYKRNV